MKIVFFNKHKMQKSKILISAVIITAAVATAASIMVITSPSKDVKADLVSGNTSYSNGNFTVQNGKMTVNGNGSPALTVQNGEARINNGLYVNGASNFAGSANFQNLTAAGTISTQNIMQAGTVQATNEVKIGDKTLNANNVVTSDTVDTVVQNSINTAGLVTQNDLAGLATTEYVNTAVDAIAPNTPSEYTPIPLGDSSKFVGCGDNKVVTGITFSEDVVGNLITIDKITCSSI